MASHTRLSPPTTISLFSSSPSSSPHTFFPHFCSSMQSSPTSPPFIPSNTTRGLSSSIWAPQPKQSPSTWPKTIDSFAREAAHIGGNNWRSQFHSRTFSTIDERPEDEDVFGPVGFNTSGGSDAPRRQVGAIGDGRRVKNVSENENDVCVPVPDVVLLSSLRYQHVQQLLRSLNLHSPAHHSPLSLNIGNTSPDLSPSTVSSALLTPVDASPAHPMSVGPFDVKVPGPDNEPSFQFSQHHRFPTEPDPLNGSVSIWPDVSNLHPSSVMDFPLARRQRFPTSPASSFPSFESMPPRPSPSPVITRAHVFPQDSTPPLHYSSPWPQTSTAWVPMPPQERRTSDFSYGHGLGLSLDDIPSPLQLQFGDSPQPTTQTHEVCTAYTLFSLYAPTYRASLADQLPVASSPVFFTAVLALCSSYHQGVRPTSFYLPSTKAQSRRHSRACKDR